MTEHIESMQKLINAFTLLGGVGKRTAERYAYDVINLSDDEAKVLAENIINAKKSIKYCKVCGTFTDKDVCDICEKRNNEVICVVKSPKDVIAFEKARKYNGVYHVLHGVLSPRENIGPDDIKIKELIKRINDHDVKEVIMATNPDVEGEVTATYIAKLIKPLGVKVTRLAQGISMGSDLQYADEVTLTKAIEDRKEM